MLENIDIYVIPSIIEESFGVAALEASAMGIPVIGSRIGGIPEIIIDRQTGILFNPGNIDDLVKALELLINSSKLRNDLGNNAREFVKNKYIWKNNVEELLNKYKQLLIDKN